MQTTWQFPRVDRAGSADHCAAEQHLRGCGEGCACLHTEADTSWVPTCRLCRHSPPLSLFLHSTIVNLLSHFFSSYPFLVRSHSPIPYPSQAFSLCRPSLLSHSPAISLCISVRVIQALSASAPLITVTAATAWQEKTNSTARHRY